MRAVALKQRAAILAAAIATAAVLAHGTAAEIAAAPSAGSLRLRTLLVVAPDDADADRDRPPRRSKHLGRPLHRVDR